jgi:hypothetical protein
MDTSVMMASLTSRLISTAGQTHILGKSMLQEVQRKACYSGPAHASAKWTMRTGCAAGRCQCTGSICRTQHVCWHVLCQIQ